MKKINRFLGYNIEVEKLELNLSLLHLKYDCKITFFNDNFLLSTNKVEGRKKWSEYEVSDSSFRNVTKVFFTKDKMGYDITPGYGKGFGLISFTGFNGLKNAITIYSNLGEKINELTIPENSFVISVIIDFVFCIQRDSNSLPLCIQCRLLKESKASYIAYYTVF